jgi:hypothetical protein
MSFIKAKLFKINGKRCFFYPVGGEAPVKKHPPPSLLGLLLKLFFKEERGTGLRKNFFFFCRGAFPRPPRGRLSYGEFKHL